MRAGKYNYQALFVNRYVEQLVIPEIQRDYVWQRPQVEGLLSSISSGFERYQNAEIPRLNTDADNSDSKQLNDDFADFYRQRNHSSNIGFIYAYSDQQYDGRYFLIDGQQRITTLYLVILLLAVRTNNESDFEKKYCTKGMPKLDYRVRDSACSFIRQLVPFVLSNPHSDIQEQSWYLKSYENDITVKNIIRNLDVIDSWLADKPLDEAEFYCYLNNFTEFWYFDTNISAQGENLYIYLNARGEQMQDNENLKADLLSKLDSADSKNKMGAEWENWQDFFWRMRAEGVNLANRDGLNADEGFNEFLNCISGLNTYLEREKQIGANKQQELKPLQSTLTQVLSLEIISKYIKVLEFIVETQKELPNIYTNVDWVKQFSHEFWSILNTNTTAWFNDYKDSRFSTEHRRMVFVWGVIHWVDSVLNADDKLTAHQIFRGIRQFYLRYKNNMRSVTGENGISSSVSNLLNTGYMSTKTEDEEYKREHWLIQLGDKPHWNDLEVMLWLIEDHPFNIDGSDVGLINSSHLIDFEDSLTLEKLTNIKDTFYSCFPVDKSRESSKFPEVLSLLLHYGQFWKRKSPWYYENYQFNDWRNIVRSNTSKLAHNGFSIFFNELMDTGLSVEELLTEKRKAYVLGNEDSLLKELLWYNYHLQESMWVQGPYIALCEYYTTNKEDGTFTARKPFLNTKGDFKGGNPCELHSLLPANIRTP